MQSIKSTISTDVLKGTWTIGRWKVPRKAVFPAIITVLIVVGLLSPLFDLHHIHGLPSAKLYSQHLFFDAIADAGGFWAGSLCKHWYHKIPVAIAFALISTLALVTIVG
jgi:hypothetical protein